MNSVHEVYDPSSPEENEWNEFRKGIPNRGSACPPLARLIEYSDIEAHLSGCEYCSRSVRVFRRAKETDQESGGSTPPLPVTAPTTVRVPNHVEPVSTTLQVGICGSEQGTASRPDATTSDMAALPEQFLKKLGDEVREHVEDQLGLIAVEMSENFGSPAVMILTRDLDHLRALVNYNAPERTWDIGIGEKQSIVAYVAGTQELYYASNVKSDPKYKRVIDKTRSELAVPIKHGRKLLGVANLESPIEGAFTDAQRADIKIACSEMVYHLLVLAGSHVCPWHPGIHGNDLSAICRRTSRFIARKVSELCPKGFAACTLFYFDEPKEQLYCYGTSGYSNKYVSEKTLSIKSFPGKVATERRKEPWDASPPWDDLEFWEAEEAKIRDINRIIAAPIYPAGNRKAKPIATLNIYFSGDTGVAATLVKECIFKWADEIGELLARYPTQKKDLLTACLDHRLLAASRLAEKGSRRSGEAKREVLESEILLRSILEFFVADGGSIFLKHPRAGNLVCVATSGLAPKPSRVPRRRLSDRPGARSASYALDAPGYTTYLANHCDRCIRKNDLRTATEKGLPENCPGEWLDEYRETLSPSQGEVRRFLGVAVSCTEGVLGVIQLVRSSRSKPFTRCEQATLEGLAKSEVCKNLLRDLRDAFPADPEPTGKASRVFVRHSFGPTEGSRYREKLAVLKWS
jgi:hypothetical protein